MNSLGVSAEQINRLMKEFQNVAKMVEEPALASGAAAAADTKTAEAAGAKKRARYMLNFEQFCKVLGFDAAAAASPTATGSGGAGAAGNGARPSVTFGAQRLFKMFDHDNSGLIDAKEFLIGLSAYADATKEDKVRCKCAA